MKISVNLLCWGKWCLSPIYVLKDAEVSHFIWKDVVVFQTAERCMVSSVDFRQVTQDGFIVNILRGTLRTSAFEGAGTEHAGLNSSPICVTFWQGRAVAEAISRTHEPRSIWVTRHCPRHKINMVFGPRLRSVACSETALLVRCLHTMNNL